MTASCSCPAKINFVLNITAKRTDGFHELDTLFLPLAALADTLTAKFDAPPGIHVASSDRALPENGGNLVGRAAELYARRAGMEPCWSFHIEKRIPVAAGLGGGSSDAAGALLLLNRHYRKLSAEELRCAAREIGADVPFFLNPVPAVAAGIGEELHPVPETAIPPLAVVFPGFPVSAKWAYAHLESSRIDPAPKHRARQAAEILARRDFRRAAQFCDNALGETLWRKFPLLSVLKRELTEAGALAVQISGSGSSLFAVAETPAGAAAIAQQLQSLHAENPELRVFEV